MVTFLIKTCVGVKPKAILGQPVRSEIFVDNPQTEIPNSVGVAYSVSVGVNMSLLRSLSSLRSLRLIQFHLSRRIILAFAGLCPHVLRRHEFEKDFHRH